MNVAIIGYYYDSQEEAQKSCDRHNKHATSASLYRIMEIEQGWLVYNSNQLIKKGEPNA